MTNSIQMTLFDYFMDSGAFTIKEANECVLEHHNRDVKIPSIRARIYEGIDKGLFKRISKGVFVAVTKENSCLLIQGNGRDLSILEDNSIDAIITDHPYQLEKSHHGGNRHLVDYVTFQYTKEDFIEKYRVLKPGGFLVEMLPERNNDNIEYLNSILTIAKECNYKEDKKNQGFDFYAVVPWKKGDFVINQGRKSKNTEDIYFFTKGRARALRFDNKKNLALVKENKLELKSEHSEDVAELLKRNGIEPKYMSGTQGMLPTEFDFQPSSRKDKIHKAEKPIPLYEDIIKYVTLEGETILDQFGGSGNLGKAALNTNRNAIVFEYDGENYEKMLSSYEEMENIIELSQVNTEEEEDEENYELE